MTIDKNSWGPYAWHLLHRVAINNMEEIAIEDRHFYYIFYTSFIFILPCIVCREHYDDIITHINPIKEYKISREYIIDWINTTHNEVNSMLDKPVINREDGINYHKKTDNSKIFYFIYGVFSNLNNNISIFDYDQIYNFFIALSHLYPDDKIKELLISSINEEKFTNISSPIDLKKWFIEQFKIIVQSIDNQIEIFI